MAAASVDLSAATGGYTSATDSVDTDGADITGPVGCTALHVRLSAAGWLTVGGGDPVPLDADVWTLVWQRSDGLTSSPRVHVEPDTGTCSVYVRVV